MSVIDLIKRRKNINYRESDDLTSATHTINEFENRMFTFKVSKNKYSGLKAAELLKLIQEEIDAVLILYHYTTKAKNTQTENVFLRWK